MRHHSYPDLIDIADSHLPFCELIRNKNADEAARTMELHITDALKDLLERWGANEHQTGILNHEE
jgi:DNA-binding GntR family transcriptional regulator